MLVLLPPHPSLLPLGEGAAPFYDTLRWERGFNATIGITQFIKHHQESVYNAIGYAYRPAPDL